MKLYFLDSIASNPIGHGTSSSGLEYLIMIIVKRGVLLVGGVVQVLLHEATLRLMTGANPSSHAARFSVTRCRRRRLDVTPPSSPASAAAASLSDDDDDDDDDDELVCDGRSLPDCRSVKNN